MIVLISTLKTHLILKLNHDQGRGRERKRNRDRQTDRQTDRERGRERQGRLSEFAVYDNIELQQTRLALSGAVVSFFSLFFWSRQ